MENYSFLDDLDWLPLSVVAEPLPYLAIVSVVFGLVYHAYSKKMGLNKRLTLKMDGIVAIGLVLTVSPFYFAYLNLAIKSPMSVNAKAEYVSFVRNVKNVDKKTKCLEQYPVTTLKEPTYRDFLDFNRCYWPSFQSYFKDLRYHEEMKRFM